MKSLYVNKDGRFTLPKHIRKKFGIKPGTKIIFIEEKDGIKVNFITPRIIMDNIGFLGKDGRLLKALLKEKEEERGL